MKPKISVCIPTYNGSQFLRECIDSILTQTFSDFELLIVDDQSSDNTVEIAEEYSAKDPRIKVMRNPQNLGLVGNWNRCLEITKGEWIKFVFQDDLLAPECLEKMMAATTFGKPIIYCRREFIFEDGTMEVTKQNYLNHPSAQNLFADNIEISARQYAELALKNIGTNFVGEPTSLMFHRNVFHQFGSFNPHLIMICDFEFYTRVAIHTGIIQVPEVLASFRVHGTAASAVCRDSRRYRGTILDELIFMHDFAFDAAYAPIRAVARQLHPKIDLVALFEQQALLAWIVVRQKQYFTEESALSTQGELETVSQYYPLIEKTINDRVLKRWIYSSKLPFKLLAFKMRTKLKRTIPNEWYLKIKSQYQQMRV